MRLARYPRAEFLAERWNYQHGEPVLLCQPMQGGKTHWAFDLLDHTPHRRPPVALVMKPRDPTPANWTKRLGWKEVQSWPPPPVMPWADRPPGYTLWPPHSTSLNPASLERTNVNLKRQFEAACMDAYTRGDRVVFADEVYGLLADLRMHEVINALITRGMGMGAALWYATQKTGGTVGAPMPGFLWNNWIHAFFGYDPVADNRKRFSQISGINADLAADAVNNLQVIPTQTPYGIKPVSEQLYVNKNGPRGGFMAIIEPW